MSPSLSRGLLHTQSDSRLVELAGQGHDPAFEVLVQRYRRQLFAYCRRLLLPDARAEDALQQALMQAWMALREGTEVRNAKTWLYRIVHNAAISALRRSGYDYVELDESLHGGTAHESDIDRRIAVREALAGLAALPDAQREVLLRTAVQGDSHEDVAAALGLSEPAVRGLVYRARATLRTAATALTPAPLVQWAARAASSGVTHPQVAEIASGTGSAGLAGFVIKTAAVVVGAGVLATGATLVERGAGSSSNADARPVHGVRDLNRPASGGGPSRGGEASRGELRQALVRTESLGSRPAHARGRHRFERRAWAMRPGLPAGSGVGIRESQTGFGGSSSPPPAGSPAAGASDHPDSVGGSQSAAGGASSSSGEDHETAPALGRDSEEAPPLAPEPEASSDEGAVGAEAKPATNPAGGSAGGGAPETEGEHG